MALDEVYQRSPKRNWQKVMTGGSDNRYTFYKDSNNTFYDDAGYWKCEKHDEWSSKAVHDRAAQRWINQGHLYCSGCSGERKERAKNIEERGEESQTPKEGLPAHEYANAAPSRSSSFLMGRFTQVD
jgi:hypothetical protein